VLADVNKFRAIVRLFG